MLHGGKLKKGRSLNRTDKYKPNSLATSAPIKRLNDQRIPQQDINPKKIVDMDMNTNTSATDTYQVGASTHNLEESELLMYQLQNGAFSYTKKFRKLVKVLVVS